MKIADLGVLDGPVLIFGGPYSNLQATEALFARAEAMGIGPDAMICTGDLVAYCADPVATAERVLDAGVPVLKGNCEEQLASGAMDCGCGFDDGSTCSILSRGWYAHADASVGADLRARMGDCPDRIVFEHAGRRVAVIHGGASAINRFIWPNATDQGLQSEIDVLTTQVGPVDMVICGHSGLSFQRQVGDVLWLNAGVIGMPENDGDPATRYAVLRDGRADLVRLPYDHVAARTAMIASGLVQGYHDALSTGFWPSEDVLPHMLRRAGYSVRRLSSAASILPN